MQNRLFPSLLACALLLSGAATAFARKPPPPRPPPAPKHPASLEQAVKQVQHRTRGHILTADTVSRGKANVYRIKVLTPQGQVRVVQMHSSAKHPPKPHKSGSNQGGH